MFIVYAKFVLKFTSYQFIPQVKNTKKQTAFWNKLF